MADVRDRGPSVGAQYHCKLEGSSGNRSLTHRPHTRLRTTPPDTGTSGEWFISLPVSSSDFLRSYVSCTNLFLRSRREAEVLHSRR